jgi:cell division transport system permease protein
VAAAAAALILTVGAGIGGWFLMRDASEKGSASDPQERDVAVFFCAASSSNPDCGHRDAEQAQKDAVRKRLLEMNGVMTVKYESKEQAYENFKKTFADRKDLLDGASPGDIPDSFRVHVTGIGVAKAVKSQFEGTPGVDTVVISTLGRA